MSRFPGRALTSTRFSLTLHFTGFGSISIRPITRKSWMVGETQGIALDRLRVLSWRRLKTRQMTDSNEASTTIVEGRQPTAIKYEDLAMDQQRHQALFAWVLSAPDAKGASIARIIEADQACRKLSKVR